MLFIELILILFREGLPKKGQIFFFFQIDKDRVKDFCTHLLQLAPLIASAADVQNDRERIRVEKQRAAEAHTRPNILDMTGVNIAFSHKGLRAVCIGCQCLSLLSLLLIYSIFL